MSISAPDESVPFVLCLGEKIRKPRANDWTPEQTDMLRRMAGHAPAADIAAALGCSLRRVQLKAQKLCLSLAVVRTVRPWTPDDIATLRRMAATHTRQQVADTLGRTLRTVIWQAGRQRISFRKHGEAHHSTRHDVATIRRIHELRAQGWGRRRIARAVGMDSSHVGKIITYGVRWREYLALDAISEQEGV